jgi:hypothetical protein
MARPAVCLPRLGGSSHGPAAAVTSGSRVVTDTAPNEAAAEASAKRLAFVQALARQAARELTAQALAARDD